MTQVRHWLGYWMIPLFLFLAAYPHLDFASGNRGQQFVPLFIYAILALGLNVVVGYTGLLHLGIAAYFGIGAYVTGILTVLIFPFQYSFPLVLLASVVVAALVGVVTTAPTLRLRGDYLALVTLGFGLIVTFVIKNLDSITDGTKGLNPISPQMLPGMEDPDLKPYQAYGHGWGRRWYNYPYLYYLCLAWLAVTLLFLRNLERSRLGRAWVALREDELAASCMGLNPARLKLAAIALGAALAGLAGCLWSLYLQTTGNPQTYDFNTSILVLCCLILGGLGNRPGVLLGVFILIGFDRIVTPELDNWVQKPEVQASFPDYFRGKTYMKVSSWRLIIFGAALIVMMRFRPEGLLPAARMKHELHPEEEDSGVGIQDSGKEPKPEKRQQMD